MNGIFTGVLPTPPVGGVTAEAGSEEVPRYATHGVCPNHGHALLPLSPGAWELRLLIVGVLFVNV